MRRSLFVLIAVVSSVFAGCASEGPAPEADGQDDTFLSPAGAADAWGVPEGSAMALGVLRVANELEREALLNDAGIATTTVNALLAFRAGNDGDVGTVDDVTVKTLAELDAIPYVGPVAFAKLLDEAVARKWASVPSDTVVTPSSDPTLARIVVRFPTVDGVPVPADVAATRQVQAQVTAHEAIIDLPPNDKACLSVTSVFGWTKRCDYKAVAGAVTTVSLAVAHIDDLEEIYSVTLGGPTSVWSHFICDKGCTSEIRFVKPEEFQRPAFFTPEGNYALLPGTYQSHVYGGTSASVTLAPGEQLTTGFVPTEETRAYLWLSAEAATLPNITRPGVFGALPSSGSLFVTWDSHNVWSTDPRERPVVITTAEDGQRAVEPLVFITGDDPNRLHSVIFTVNTGWGSLNYEFQRPAGTSANIALRRIDVPATGLPLKATKERVSVQRIGDAGGLIEGQKVEFDTGFGIDVLADQYQVTITDGPGGPVLKEYRLDLR